MEQLKYYLSQYHNNKELEMLVRQMMVYLYISYFKGFKTDVAEVGLPTWKSHNIVSFLKKIQTVCLTQCHNT